MIIKANRFHGYGSLRHVYQNGKTARGPVFAAKAVANPRRQSYRLAVVVSRKVSKSAVKRNRMRRRLYAAARELAGILKPYDIVVTIFNERALDQPFEQLKKQLQTELASLGAIDKAP